MISSSCFEFGLYGIRPCGSRTRPVRDIMDGYLPPVWAGGGRIVRVTIVIVRVRPDAPLRSCGRVDEGSYLPPPPTDPDVRN